MGRSGQLTIRDNVCCHLAKSENNSFLLIIQKALMVYMSLALLSMAGVTTHKKHRRNCSLGMYNVSNSRLISLEISEMDDYVSINCSRLLK